MASSTTNTRASLIARLSDPDGCRGVGTSLWRFICRCCTAWRGGRACSTPTPRSWARKCSWPCRGPCIAGSPIRSAGRFRDWLFRIARNVIINFLTRPKHRTTGSGNSDVMRMLREHAAERWRRNGRVRSGISARSFPVGGGAGAWHGDADHVAGVLANERRSAADCQAWPSRSGMTVGSVYIARSRVMAKLRDEASRFCAASGGRVDEHTTRTYAVTVRLGAAVGRRRGERCISSLQRATWRRAPPASIA